MKNSRVLQYVLTIKYHIIFSILLFCGAIFHGFLTALNDPAAAKEIMLSFEETFGPIAELPNWKMLIVLLLNNGIKALVTSFAGLMAGIPPFIFLWGNGFIVGILGALFQEEGHLLDFFIGITPHGIFEIPALMLSGAVGFKLSSVIPKKIFFKRGAPKKEISDAAYFFIKVIAPLLLIAAIIESFITPFLVKAFL